MMANPFMCTTNECYGLSLEEASKAVFTYNNQQSLTTTHSNNPNSKEPANHLSFLYSRESDRFGEDIAFSDSSQSQVFHISAADRKNRRRKSSACLIDNNTSSSETEKNIINKNEINEMLTHYNHCPKKEDPLYVTTANEYGHKKPTSATYQTVSFGVTQKFSRSFNNVMYKNEGLNSSMVTSKIHDSLTNN